MRSSSALKVLPTKTAGSAIVGGTKAIRQAASAQAAISSTCPSGWSEKDTRHAAALRVLHEQREQLGKSTLRQGSNTAKYIVQHAQSLYIPCRDAEATTSLDESGYSRVFMYCPNGQPTQDCPVVDCHSWDMASESRRREIMESALARLRASGYVVLEKLLCAELLLAAGEAFRRYKSLEPEGVTFGRMRAQRDMTIVPFEGIFLENALTRHPLVLSLLARYLRNSLDTRHDGKAQMELVQWIANGAPIDHFLDGPLSGGFPVLDLMTVVDTPPGAPAQTRHRDTILPGPCASLGVHIPLTHLQLDPLNGAIGFTPGSHRLFGDAMPKKDVVGAAPLGSVILYDSFTEHHGLENNSSSSRAALFCWYRVPGVNSGHSDENFGRRGLDLTMRFRDHLQKRLAPVIDAERRRCPSAACRSDHPQSFSPVSPLATWGEDKVCFRCNCTTGTGAFHNAWWFCKACWSKSRQDGKEAPEPAPANVAPPFPDGELLSEQWLIEQESFGMNIRPSRGRHKLALLRERGVFLPVDPSSEWLAGVSTEPQPEMWRNALRDGAKRRLNPSLPRSDGF